MKLASYHSESIHMTYSYLVCSTVMITSRI